MSQFAKKLKLANGLTVIYEPIPNSGVVSINIGVKVGSSDEASSESGLCHLIEHMVFKGTKSFGVGEIATRVEAAGGELNAYTSFDQTVYYINLPASQFGIGIKLLKEMVFDAKFDPAELEREKEVVVEEIRRGKDSPQRVLGEVLFSSAYRVHPYKNQVIGTEKHVRGFPRHQVHEFYKSHYSPHSIILGICGDIPEAELNQTLEELFQLETGLPTPRREQPLEPAKTRTTINTASMDITTTYFDLAFQVPSLNHADVPALDILSFLLGEGDTSRLEQNVKETKQLVHHIYTSNYTPRHPGLFVVGGQVDAKKLNLALAAVREEILHCHNRLPAPKDIERAKLILRSRVIYEKETCEGTAGKWMSYETTVDDFDFDARYLAGIETVTAADIMRVAQTYLDLQKVTVAVLHPKGVKIAVDKSLFKNPKKEPRLRFKPTLVKDDVALYKLSNGLSVALRENKRLPIVSLKLVGLGGLRAESPTNNGITSLTASLLTKGTKTRTYLEIAEAVEGLAGSLNGYAGRNTWGISQNFLSEKFEDALPLFADVLLNPAFDPREVEKEKRQQLEAIRNQADNPAQIVFLNGLKKIFSGHPFRLPMLGDAKSVRSLNAAKLKAWHQARLDPKGLVIAASGDFDSQRLLETLEAELAGLKSPQKKELTIKVPNRLKGVTHLFEAKDKKQAHVAIGFLSASLNSRDRFAIDLINNILSGQGGRLFLELRDKQSLAYTVSASVLQSPETGLFATYIGCDPSKVKTAIAGMLGEIQRLRDEPVSAIELERAKTYVLGNQKLDNQKNGSIAMQLALSQLYHGDLDDHFLYDKNLLAITSDDIQKTAKRYLTPEHCVISVVGPKGCDK
jgi:zinc protease